MAEDLIGYDQLTQDAMREVVRAALNRATGPRGLPGQHHFYITFRTKAPGVILPDQLLGRYPDEMTIVLEHQFWDLEVYADKFRVILKFAGQPHPIVIPFNAVSRFYDPSVRFGLQFEHPRPSVGTLEGPPAGPVEVGLLGCQAFSRQVCVQDSRYRSGLRQLGIQTSDAQQQPVHVHRRMPVVAAVEGRMDPARREVAMRRVEQVVELAGVFARDVCERRLCEACHEVERQPACAGH